MSAAKGTSVDLVPLTERMRLMALFRVCAVAILLLAWWALPWTRGVSLAVLAGASVTYLAIMATAQIAWARLTTKATGIFGLSAMADGLFLTWATYGQAGLSTPTRHLILLQIVTVCLLASLRTGLKVALFDTWVLLGVVYLQELGALPSVSGVSVEFGDQEYRVLATDIALAFLAAVVTAGFAAVNERELRRRRYDLEALAQFALDLDRADHPADVARCLLDAVADAYGFSPSIVVHCESEGRCRVIAACGVNPHGRLMAPVEVPELQAAVQRPGVTLLAHRETDGDAALACFEDHADLVIVPLRGRHGTPAGALVVQVGVHVGRIERRLTGMLERFASHASLALENTLLLAEVRSLALTDPLTGVANRRELDHTIDRQVGRVRRGAGTLALLMLDLDHFKLLNDTHGHQAGDEVLRRTARAVEQELRAGDLVGRYGGEEFAVVMAGRRPEELAGVAERIRVAIARMAGPAPVTVSIGVAWAPAHGLTRATLTKAADDALYSAKSAGRNRVVVADAASGGEALAS